MITFQSFRLPRVFITLCLCVGIIAGIGYSGALYRQQTRYLSVPVAADLGQPEEITPAAQGEVVPDFTIDDLSGRAVSLSSYRGRPVILYFWATWCPYCIDEMPALGLLRDSYQDAGLEILAVNILEQPAQVRKATGSMNLTYPVLLDDDARVTRSFVVRATPTFILIDRDGVYRDIVIGSPRPGVLESKIAPLLENPQQDS